MTHRHLNVGGRQGRGNPPLHRACCMHTEDGGHEFLNGHVFPLDQREAWHDEPAPSQEDAAYWPYVVIAFIAAVAVIGWAIRHFS